MELFDKHYYKMTKVLLSFLGLWPGQKPCVRRCIRTIVCLCMLSIVIPEVIKLFSVLDDLEIVFECIPPLGLHLLNLIKCGTYTWHIDKLHTLMRRMEDDWKSRLGEKGSILLLRYAERGRVLAVAYAYYMFVGGSLYVCAPLLPLVVDIIHPLSISRPREFLFRTEYFVDQDEYFVPIFLHAFVTTLISMVIVVAVDTLYSAYVHYACAILAELGTELQNLGTIHDVSPNVSLRQDYIYHRIVKCVIKHNKAFAFCNLMEVTYSLYFLWVIGTEVFLISFTGIQIVMRMEDPNLVMRYSCYALGQIIHAFYGCWHGQLLIDHSEKIAVSIYKSEWYKFSLRSRKLLILMMMRSAKPCRLSAGKVFSVSLETFTTIMKSAMSYFTVLRSLQ